MKYTVEIDINLSREEFITKFDNPNNMKHWQRGLLSYELLSKDQRVNGAQNEVGIPNREAKNDAN